MTGSSVGKVIAFFISPHGFGHAARACSVIQELAIEANNHEIILATTVPRWFFEASLNIPFDYYPLQTDIGLIQSDPITVNIQGSLDALSSFLPFSETIVANVAKEMTNRHCDLIVSDISPLGIAVAEEVGIPSLLLENFTWDWIYRGYQDEDSEFGKFADYLEEVYSHTSWHILAEPFCKKKDVNLICRPISRKPRSKKSNTRERLQIEDERPIVLVSMGGIESKLPNSHKLKSRNDLLFLVPGSGDQLTRHQNIICFPHKSEFYHPDLIELSDVVISKIGYSTLAEVYQAGLPFGYIPRVGFRESKKLETFILRQMAGIEISEREYRDGDWIAKLNDLMELPRLERPGLPGSKQAAQFLLEKLNAKTIG
ncbi:MAG: hypothetical protein MJE63_32885 [Proteobacteria bacterium]|nr:hypothetical protein [Pseudomonadota bacterium]